MTCTAAYFSYTGEFSAASAKGNMAPCIVSSPFIFVQLLLETKTKILLHGFVHVRQRTTQTLRVF